MACKEKWIGKSCFYVLYGDWKYFKVGIAIGAKEVDIDLGIMSFGWWR